MPAGMDETSLYRIFLSARNPRVIGRKSAPTVKVNGKVLDASASPGMPRPQRMPIHVPVFKAAAPTGEVGEPAIPNRRGLPYRLAGNNGFGTVASIQLRPTGFTKLPVTGRN